MYIGAADNLNGFHNFIGFFLQPFLYFFGYGEHGGGTERISRMHAKGVNIFNKAYGNHVVVRIPDYFQFQFFPAQNGFFHQYLSNKTGLKSSCTDGFQFFHIVYKTASCAAHGIGRTQDHRISQFVCNFHGFFHRVGYFASCHLNAKAVHGFFKFYPVFASFNGIHLYADHLHIVFVQNSCFGKF